MSQNLRILDELGEELERAAERTLGRGSKDRPVWGRGGEAVALAGAIVVAVVVAVVALGVLHPRSHTPAASPGKTGPRGSIVDRTGRTLVASRAVVSVKVDPSGLPHRRSVRTAEMRRLALALASANLAPGTSFSRRIAGRLATFNRTHRGQFPGVTVGRGWVRIYPLHDLAAQLLGTVGPVNQTELRAAPFAGTPAATVGQSGLEAYYDSALRSGETLKLSLDVPLQTVGQQALKHSIASNHPANGGAFVAMNPQNGAVYAMGSLPTYDPNVFTKPISNSTYNALFGPNSGDPQINRAYQSAGPPGSTFKPITATAALESGAWTVDHTFDDAGQFCSNSQCRHNAGNAADGKLNVESAIKVSSDDFFYNLGVLTNSSASDGGPLQHWTRLYGIGQKTGIDLPDESAGTLPDAAWRAHRNELEAECDTATGQFQGKPKHPPGGCGIADGSNRPWSAGDNESLAVGQGDVQVTPLQLAVAYAAIANGGTIVRPHAGMDIQRPDGTLLQSIDPAPARQLNISPRHLDVIRQGLRDAASQPGGSAADVFGGFPEQVYGETGTAQYNGQQDYAWYAGYVPASATTKPIVVVVTVQQGGFGAAAAAPVARQILSQWFLGRPGPWAVGRSRTL
jgi:penicillin-binding protein 2